ncbi:MAG: thioredoxin family protein [Chlamydiales bacterium]|nr:thioredoxin family protein [Chlamydiales bacterium]
MRKHLLTACILALTLTPAFAAGHNGNNARRQPQASANQHSGQIKWHTNYNEAQAEAKRANKPILLFFTGSDWCGWCKRMDQEVFESAEFARAVGNDFVFVEVDFPMQKPLPPELQQQNNSLKQKYGVTGYPTIIILDSSGNFIAEAGYRPGGGKAYADYLKQLLK